MTQNYFRFFKELLKVINKVEITRGWDFYFEKNLGFLSLEFEVIKCFSLWITAIIGKSAKLSISLDVTLRSVRRLCLYVVPELLYFYYGEC